VLDNTVANVTVGCPAEIHRLYRLDYTHINYHTTIIYNLCPRSAGNGILGVIRAGV